MSNQWRVLGHRGHSAFSIRCYRECEWIFWPTDMPLFQGHEPCSGLKNFHASGLLWNSIPCPSTSQMNYRHKTLMLQSILQTKSHSSLTHVQIISHGHNGWCSSHYSLSSQYQHFFQTFFRSLKTGFLVTRPPQEVSSTLILWHTNSFEVPLHLISFLSSPSSPSTVGTRQP